MRAYIECQHRLVREPILPLSIACWCLDSAISLGYTMYENNFENHVNYTSQGEGMARIVQPVNIYFHEFFIGLRLG